MRILLGVSFLLACNLYGQRISVGVVGGTNVTGNYAGRNFSSAADEFNPAYRVHYMTGSRSLILGAMIEGHLTDQLSIEANVLHRPMKALIRQEASYADGSVVLSEEDWTPLRVWAFPILLKYTLPESRWTGPVRPFVALGPSFRTQEDATATEPSQIGISTGAGVALHLGRFRLSPTLRYTRWARDNVNPKHDTKPDQVEFLASFSYDTHAESRRFGTRKFDIGAIGGFSLNDTYESDFGDTMERWAYLAGLTVESPLNDRWALEADAIYKPLRAAGDFNSTYVVLTWEFPVLAKYRWERGGWTTFVAAGPSFRLSGNLNGYRPSPVGATVGAGLETQTKGMRFSAGPRYTRWLNDLGRSGPERTNPHALEMVFGVSF